MTPARLRPIHGLPNPDLVWPDEALIASDHLAAMEPERRGKLEREWLAGEALNDRAAIEAELREIVEANRG